MIQLREIVELKSGTPQFRINETSDARAPVYLFYGQSDLEDDCWGRPSQAGKSKQIRTFDAVSTLKTGDIVFSLISGKAALVGKNHDGYLFTQNFVLLMPKDILAPTYLAYLLNEDSDIRRQLSLGQQGSITMKFTVNQLAELNLVQLPPLQIQELIGTLYFNGLRLETLRNHRAKLETILINKKIKEAIQP